MKESDRRTFLKTAAIGGAAAAASSTVARTGLAESGLAEGEAPAPMGGRVGAVSSKYFRVEIKGMYGKVPGVVSADPGKVTVKVKESTQGDKPDYREYTYGSHDYDDLTLTVMTGPGNVKLQKWAEKAMKSGGRGSALRRDISMYLLARDKSTVLRTINCFGCYPISMNAGDYGTGSDVKTITFSCNVSRIEVA